MSDGLYPEIEPYQTAWSAMGIACTRSGGNPAAQPPCSCMVARVVEPLPRCVGSSTQHGTGCTAGPTRFGKSIPNMSHDYEAALHNNTTFTLWAIEASRAINSTSGN